MRMKKRRRDASPRPTASPGDTQTTACVIRKQPFSPRAAIPLLTAAWFAAAGTDSRCRYIPPQEKPEVEAPPEQKAQPAPPKPEPAKIAPEPKPAPVKPNVVRVEAKKPTKAPPAPRTTAAPRAERQAPAASAAA